MFDDVHFDKRAIATVARVLKKANARYGSGEMERFNHAFRILSGRVELEPPPYPWQKPEFYVPGVPAKTWYGPDEIPQMSAVEAAYETIKRELLNILNHRSGFGMPTPVNQGIVKSGAWDFFWVKDGCKKFEENWALCPETRRLIDSLPRVGESAIFSALRPGTHIHPHCGVYNLRLTLHLPLIVPENCELRVAQETRGWEEGKCVVFNDSFVHESSNYSESSRYNLILDIWHPDLSAAEIQVLEELLHLLDPPTPRHPATSSGNPSDEPTN